MDFYKLTRPLLFRLDPEKAHHLTLAGLRMLTRLKADSLLSPGIHSEPVEVMGIKFPNRIGLAAGLDKAGNCISGFGAMGFGSVEVGTITPLPQNGNPKPRLFRIREREAIINRMGFNNPGIDAALKNIANSRKGFAGIVGINIGKNKDTDNSQAIDDYLTCFRKAYPSADYIAVNISSPNTVGLRELQLPETARNLLLSLKQEQQKLHEESGKYVPFAVKIAPDMESRQILALADLFNDVQIDAVIATNTTIRRDNLQGVPHENEKGGLSGSPLARQSTEVIAALYKAMDKAIPIIGAGGIDSAKQARAKIEAGAKLVQIYTGLIYRGPSLVNELLNAKL
ncbi:MAG: quinone-dependent dihydroorotate dehydrogenase [Verrucomicrobiaceae bacterium]|nr:quinone-dependent dihydroorotate dehydrogenase [Verrucomicrobiaceae bacterium]